MATARQIVQLLGEMDELKAEKDVVQFVNPAKATYLQCQIFRIFGVIKTLQRSNPDEVTTGMANQVLWKRKEVNAGAEDMKAMPIPSLVTTKKLEEWKAKEEKQKNELFPFPYLLLPPEVRETILGYLTSPSDKLSFIKAIPEEADMMGWNVNSLRLELSLPIVFQRNPELRRNDTLNLCRARADLHDVVKNCFDSTLADPFAVTYLKNLVGSGWTDPRGIDPADYVLNPLPITVILRYNFDAEDGDFEFEGDYDDWKLKQLDVLRQCGENVWSVTIEVNFAPSTKEMIQLIRDCLELVPNLRNLTVEIEVVNDKGGCQDVEQFQEIVQFPELKYLRQLQLDGEGSGVLHAKLLEKYRPVIQTLKADPFSDIPILPEGEASYPRLTHLDAFDTRYYKEEMHGRIAKLNAFVGTGLKSIRVHGSYNDNNAQDFVTLLAALSQFGETLEYLSVEFASNKLPSEDDEEVELVKLGDLKFPKVKTLEVRSYPRTWAVLLHFPALEHLIINSTQVGSSFYQSPANVSGWTEMDLSFVKEELYTSNVWKLLPFLESFELVDGWPRNGFKVTRSQCRTYQRKLTEIEEQIGRVDNTRKGSLDCLFQPSDTSLVVEGDVNGNVVQDGNGRILVNGCVRGKIEQKGNGKIFVRGKHLGKVVKTGNGVVQVDWGNVNN